MVSIKAPLLFTYTNYTVELFIREFRMGNDLSEFYCFDSTLDPLVASNRVSFLKRPPYDGFLGPYFTGIVKNPITDLNHVIRKDNYPDNTLLFKRFSVEFQVGAYGLISQWKLVLLLFVIRRVFCLCGIIKLNIANISIK